MRRCIAGNGLARWALLAAWAQEDEIFTNANIPPGYEVTLTAIDTPLTVMITLIRLEASKVKVGRRVTVVRHVRRARRQRAACRRKDVRPLTHLNVGD